MMVMPPEKRPAAPVPATALPTMRVGEFIETAQTMEPISKTAMAKTKVHLTLKKV
jgi:hypothetical protein